MIYINWCCCWLYWVQVSLICKEVNQIIIKKQLEVLIRGFVFEWWWRKRVASKCHINDRIPLTPSYILGCLSCFGPSSNLTFFMRTLGAIIGNHINSLIIMWITIAFVFTWTWIITFFSRNVCHFIFIIMTCSVTATKIRFHQMHMSALTLGSSPWPVKWSCWKRDRSRRSHCLQIISADAKLCMWKVKINRYTNQLCPHTTEIHGEHF